MNSNMNRRRFSALLSAAAGAALAPSAPAFAQGAAGRGQGFHPRRAAAAARRSRRQDRGAGVLLVRLPALQRVRADRRGLGKAAAGRRELSPRAGALPHERRQLHAHVLRARDDRRRAADAAEDLSRHPHREKAPREGRGHRRLRRCQRRRRGQVPRRVQVVLGQHLGGARQEADGRLQDRQRADARRPRPLDHLADARPAARSGRSRSSTSWSHGREPASSAARGRSPGPAFTPSAWRTARP